MRAIGSSAPHQPALVAGIGIAAVALIVAMSFSRAWEAVEAKVFDIFTSFSAQGVNTQPIVILAIDEPTFQELRLQWPYPRSLHGQVLERVRADGARAVAFDVVFAEPSTPQEDAAFARSIRRAGNVVLASSQERITNANADLWTQVPPLDDFIAAGAVAGDISVLPDPDFVIRRQATVDGSLAARLARFVQPAAAAPATPPTLIEYLGPRGTIDTRSYYQALEPGLLPPGFFRDKLVLIGRSVRSAVELQTSHADMFNSPFAVTGGGERLFPGVEVQATMLANRLSGGGLHQAHAAWGYALLAMLGTLVLVAGRRLHPGATLAVSTSCAVFALGLSYALFAWQKLWLPPLLPVAAVVALYGSTTLASYLVTRRHAQRVRGMFAQYVPPPIVDRLIAQPDLMRLGGETREVTLMFTDLANFTTLTERLSPTQTVDVLTSYFNAMTRIVMHHEGTLDKYIGDAVMAIWGAPLDDAKHAEHAVRAAIEMQVAMDDLVRDLQARGLPPIGMRVGLHTGPAVTGNFGSDQRFAYTAIGDAVNLAARLEGANKAFGTRILISASTAAQLPPQFRLRALDDVIVKGKTEPIRVFTPCDDEALSERSARALEAFHARDWSAAEEALRAILAAHPADLTAQRLLARVEEARAAPADAAWSPAVALDKL